MKVIKIWTIVLLFYSITINVNNCKARSIARQQDTIKLDTSDSVAVVKYITDSKLCEKIMYVQNNLTDFANEKKYSHLILQSISSETKKSITILGYNHHGAKSEEQSKKDFLAEQMKKLLLEYCN